MWGRKVGEETSLRLSAGSLERIRLHAERSYPSECCGALVGEMFEAVTRVRRAIPAENAHHDRERRYEIAPEEILRILGTARSRDEQIVGYYHSHPDRPARPSMSDHRDAWPRLSYVIVSAGPDGDGTIRSWRRERGGSLREQPIVVGGGIGSAARGADSWPP